MMDETIEDTYQDRLERENARLRAELTHERLLREQAEALYEQVQGQCKQLRDENERLRWTLHRISLASQNSMSTKTECGALARKALLNEELSVSNAKAAGSYSLHRIAWELAQTASGNAYYGNALRVAKDLPGLCDTDRALLDRYATGNQTGTDHIALCDLAIRINALQKEPAP